jgi:2-dehydropantoate 2-reductase
MRTLIVGVGALGGVIGARLLNAGATIFLATRDEATAYRLRTSGLRVSGVGGDVALPRLTTVAPIDCYRAAAPFDLVLLATKARDAINLAPGLADLLAGTGVLLPIQNGAVSQLLDERIPGGRVLAGLSNLGATMVSPGIYEQRNAGHLLIGELGGGVSARADRVREWLARGIDVRISDNMTGAIWSKLLLNCSVTTLGAIAGVTMREYITAHVDVFAETYREALSVALASGVRPEHMLVDPVPPGWTDGASHDAAFESWLQQVLQNYGDVKPSMLQDFERGRPTEIDFINGYVVDRGSALGIPTPVNAAIVQTVRAITRREMTPHPDLLTHLFDRVHAHR